MDVDFIKWVIEQGAIWTLVIFQAYFIYKLWGRLIECEDHKATQMMSVLEVLTATKDTMSRVLERLR